MPQKKPKPERPDEYLNRNMPERVKKLDTLARASARAAARAAWVKKQREEKGI